MSSIDISVLNSKLGAYLRTNKDVLIAKTLLNQSLEDRFEVMDDCKDEVPLPNLSITDIIKPADPTTFSPTANALKFGARTLKARSIKVDLLLIPDVLEKTWLGKYKKAGSNPMDLPFEAFIMDYIAQKAQENLHLKAIYKGVYNAAGTAPGDTMTGLLKIIADEILATNITPIVTGAITADNVITSLEAVYDGLGEAYKASPTQLIVNPTIYNWYNRKYRAAYGANTDYAGMGGKLMLDGTQCEVIAEPGLGTSQRVIATSKENKVYGVDTVGDTAKIRTQEFDRSIKVMMDFKAGVEFKEISSEALSVNDQA
jgi:hypothetical protein